MLLVAALSGCGNSETSSDSDGGKDQDATGFEVTREDGSTFELVTFVADCPELPKGDPDAGLVHGYASLAGTRIDLTGGKRPKGPVATVTARDGLAEGTRLELPIVEDSDNGGTGVSFFIGDGRNETSSGVEDATGSIEIIRAECEPEPILELRIDGTLGSEFFDGEVLKVRGYGRLE